jgi:hypothetical protein
MVLFACSEQEVCLEDTNKGQHHATVPLPDVPVPTPVTSPRDPYVGPLDPGRILPMPRGEPGKSSGTTTMIESVFRNSLTCFNRG